MSRKNKIGIDYFSHDVDMLQDIKVKLLKAKFGLIGYAIYLRLLEEIYRDFGYYLKVDDDFNMLFSDDNNIDLNEYILVLNDCINKNLFSKKMYDDHKILTSGRVQINYCAATERRKEVVFISNYLLINVNEKYNTGKVNVIINELNADINPQRKGKERKGKKIKLNPLVDKQKFIDELPESVFKKGHSKKQVDDTTDDLISYCNAHGKTYKDYNAALSNFLKKIIPDKSENKTPLQQEASDILR